MPANPPASVRDLYRECAAQLGECYCSITRSGVCYRGAPPADPPGRRLAAYGMAVALIGVLIWPLGPLAWFLGARARRKLPAAATGDRGAARWAYVLGLAESFFCVYVAIVIAGSHL